MTKQWVLILFLMIVFSGYGQEWKEVQKIFPEVQQKAGDFGNSVAIWENFVIVGASDKPAPFGTAYIFERQKNGDWTQVSHLAPTDKSPDDRFGRSVSIFGNYAMVGADTDNENAGSVYVFERDRSGRWSSIQQIVSSDGSKDDFFGNSVYLWGRYAIIGAPYKEKGETGNSVFGAGGAYLFKRQSNGKWEEVQKFTSSVNNLFGRSVSLTDKYAIIGASGGKETAAYIYEKNTAGKWIETQKLVAPDSFGYNHFGFSVSIYEETAIVGSFRMGSAFMYQREGSGNWKYIRKLTSSNPEISSFGRSVAINQAYAVIGGFSEETTERGAAIIFKKDSSGNWNELQRISASDGTRYNKFGDDVGISGHNVVIGASWQDGYDKKGAAYIFSNCPYYAGTLSTESICADSTANIQAEIIPYNTDFSWSTGDTTKSISVSPEKSTTYYLTTGDSTCQVTDSIHIKVNHPPEMAITKGNDTTIISGSQIGLKGNPETGNHWYPPLGLSCTDCYDPVAFPAQNTTYHLTVTDSNGCVSHDSLTIEVMECTGQSLYIPSAFTPNGDGINDEFCLYGGGIELDDFSIYNRWGGLVFQTRNFHDSWDGRVNGKPVNPGIYPFHISGRCINSGEKFIKTGHVTMVR